MIDMKKNAGEIGRHLRNHNYELSEGGVLIKGGMNALVNGVFKDTLYSGGSADSQISPNLVVNQFLIHMLNVLFVGQAQVTQWYIGLIANNVSPQATWTAQNIVAQAGEVVGYPGVRPGYTVSATSAPSLSNGGTGAMFEFDDAGPYTARGAFLISSSAKGSTSGVLCAATRFANDRAGLNSPDRLGVEYTITAQDAG